MADYTVNYSPSVYEVYASDGGARSYTDLSVAAHNAAAAAHGLTGDDWAAIQGAASPSAANVLATMISIAPRLGYASPLDYGAVGDGTTDDTTAVSNAAATGRLFIPANYTFKVVSTITLSSDFFVCGEGTIKFEPAAADNLFEISGATRVVLRDFRIMAGNGNPVDAISINNGISVLINAVTVDGLRSGPMYSFTGAAIRITSTLPNNSWSIDIAHCRMSSLSGSGLIINGDATGYIEMLHTVITQCDGYGVKIDSAARQSLQVEGGVIQGCYLGTFNTLGIMHTRLIGVGFENTGGLTVSPIIIAGNTLKSEIVIENCSIGQADAPYAIDITGGGSSNIFRAARISNNSFFGKAGGKILHSDFVVSATSLVENDVSGYSSTDIRTLLDFTYAQSVIIFDNTGWDIYSVGAPSVVDWPIVKIAANRFTSGTAAPTAGAWLRGDIVFNSAPAAGGVPGWVCVTAGTPGTWKAMAALEA